jgi:hypothetical protein
MSKTESFFTENEAYMHASLKNAGRYVDYSDVITSSQQQLLLHV